MPAVEACNPTISEKTIWSFWHSGDANLSDLHRLCVASWRAQNPGWDIRIIDRDNVHEYVSPSELPAGWKRIETPCHQADAARLAVLKCHGGVYLDISVMLLTNLDIFIWQGLSEKQYSYFGFYNPDLGVAGVGKEDVVPWFMATQKDNPLIARWHEVFCQLMDNRSNVHDISKHPLLHGVDLTHLKEWKDYLAMNAVMKRLIDTEPQMRAYWQHRSNLLNCNESGYKWRAVFDVREWYTEHEMESFIRPNPPEAHWVALKDVPLIKLNNAGGSLASCTYDDLLNSDSLIARLFSKAFCKTPDSQQRNVDSM